jgi:hypothetical protein
MVMNMSNFLLFQVEPPTGIWGAVVEFFLTDNTISGAYESGTSWFITAIVISIICTGLMLLAKYLFKQGKPLVLQGWRLGRAVGHSLLGLVPVLIILLIIYFTNLSFQMVLQPPGLFKGIFFAWILYLLFEMTTDWIIWRSDWNPRRS